MPESSTPDGNAKPRNDRAVPPDDISPLEFFTVWVPEMVSRDERRQKKLGKTEARIVFAFDEPQHGEYTIFVESGVVRGEAGRVDDWDLEIRVGIET